jgi:hypothetical protein
MGRFSKVTLNSPPPKLRKFLQIIPIITLIAVSIAAVVKALTLFFKIKNLLFLSLSYSKGKKEAHIYAVSLLLYEAGCKIRTANVTFFVQQTTPRSADTSRPYLYSSKI